MSEVWVQIFGAVSVAALTALVAPSVIERIKGTEAREKTEMEDQLAQLKEWREAKDQEHREDKKQLEETRSQLHTLRVEKDQLALEVERLKREFAHQVDLTAQHQRANEILDSQVTQLRNENIMLLRRIANMERHS